MASFEKDKNLLPRITLIGTDKNNLNNEHMKITKNIGEYSSWRDDSH